MRACRLLGSVRGYVAPGFEPVREAFRANVREGKENPGGAQLAVRWRGRLVVDVVAGGNPAAPRRRLVNVFSSGKVLESLCVAKLVDMGRLSYDAPIGKYWPEFAKRISPHITVTDLMRHNSGLCGWQHPFDTMENARRTFRDKSAAEEYLLRNVPPEWDAAKDHKQAYHAFTRGSIAMFYAAKWTRRSRHGDIFQEEIAEPLALKTM